MSHIDAESLPRVTVIMPIRNEAAYLERSLGAVLTQDYPADRMDVVVADGMSTDGTRIIVRSLQAQHPNLRLINNPGKIVSTGLNVALAMSQSDVIIRVDGHCEVARDFVRQNVATLAQHPEAWSVGGPIVHAAKGQFGKAVALAMSHPFGIGDATHRYVNYEGYAEGAQFPAIRRWVFERIGLFDEHLVRNQDDEFNYRIAQAGGRVYISPRIRYTYYVRERMSQLLRQYFQYGYWRIPVIRKHQRPTTLRQLAPILFYGALVGLASCGLWLRQPIIAFTLPTLYGAALVTSALSVLRRAGFQVACRVPLAILAMHAGYALGFAYGILASLFSRNAWDHEGQMAALSR